LCYVNIIYVLFVKIPLIGFIEFNASHWNLDLLCRSGIEYRRAVLEVSRLCDWN